MDPPRKFKRCSLEDVASMDQCSSRAHTNHDFLDNKTLVGDSTILKNMSSSMGRIIAYMKWKIKNVWNHQPEHISLQKINVESTKVYKVVKLEKKKTRCGLCSINPHRDHFCHWKDLTAVRPCRRWWFFRICLHQLWGLGSKSTKPYNEPMMGTQIPLEEHFTGHVVGWSVWRANADFAFTVRNQHRRPFKSKRAGDGLQECYENYVISNINKNI